MRTVDELDRRYYLRWDRNSYFISNHFFQKWCTVKKSTIESGYLANFVIWDTSSIRRMFFSCLNSTLHSLSGAHNLTKRKMGGAGY